MKILVTGASGFVGRAVCRAALAQGHAVTAVVRRTAAPPGTRPLRRDGFDGRTDWRPDLLGVDAVIHLAAITHGGTAQARASDYHSLNVEATTRLGECAAEAGVNRFVFMSSVKAIGESSPRVGGEILSLHGDSETVPEDAYGHSKLAAEQSLLSRSDLNVTVLRPPLVYGYGHKGNLAALERAIRRGVPLPLAGINNRRSLIGVGNLADATLAAAMLQTADSQVLTLKDYDASTPDLVRALARALGCKARLFPCPRGLLRGVAGALGQRARAERLLGDLVVDAERARMVLGWQPSRSFDEGMKPTRSTTSRTRPA